MKEFEGQYSDEKLLLKRHESIVSLLLAKYYHFIFSITFSIVIYFTFLYINLIYYGLAIIILLLIILIIYFRNLYLNTFLIISSRRILKIIKNSLFSSHRKELKLLDIKAVKTRKNFIEMSFGYGTIMIQGTEVKSNIFFKGLRGHSDISNYIGRIVDYIKMNGHTDNLSVYKGKKERNKLRMENN